jgi:RNA polymerase sigma-70 factor (ECF subfamily)
MAIAILERAQAEAWTDEEVVSRVLAGETALFEIVMRRYNQRLYRVARAILRDDDEAEDVMQDAYVRAYQHLEQFQGRARFSTWLTRIAIHESLSRLRRRGRWENLDDLEPTGETMDVSFSLGPDPETHASHAQLREVLESSILNLPEHYRSVLMMRDVEEMSTEETAAALGLTEENVKVRLHRARAMLRRDLYARAGATSSAAFQFHAPRCDRVVRNVFARIAQLS